MDAFLQSLFEYQLNKVMDSVSQKHHIMSIFHKINSSPSTLSLISFMLLPQEGHELVRARHPGSAKIEEFLVQLGGLWEELRRRHQRNAVFLQASEELGFRVKAYEKCDSEHCAQVTQRRFTFFINMRGDL